MENIPGVRVQYMLLKFIHFYILQFILMIL